MPISFSDTGTFSGTVHYSGVAAFLNGPGFSRMLLMFKPAGDYTTADIGATSQHLQFVLGKLEGFPLTVTGPQAPLFGEICIFFTSAG